jgi:hypothetical protein
MVRVQALIWHGDANMLLRYTHVRPDPLADPCPCCEGPKRARGPQKYRALSLPTDTSGELSRPDREMPDLMGLAVFGS